MKNKNKLTWKKYNYEVLRPGMIVKFKNGNVSFVGDNFTYIGENLFSIIEYINTDFVGLVTALKNEFQKINL